MSALLDWQAREPHRAAPGPGAWSWRCRACGGLVADRALHPRRGRLRAALRRWWLERPS